MRYCFLLTALSAFAVWIPVKLIIMEENRTYELRTDPDRGFTHGVNLFNIMMRSSSVVALLVAIGIFLSSRNLYKRDNVKIHINLFVSNILMDVSFVYLEVIQHNYLLILKSIPDNDYFALYKLQNEPSCEMLTCTVNALRIFFELCNYSWMTCEACYLFYMIYRVWFDKRIVLIIIQAAGWGIPAVLTTPFVVLTSGHCRLNPTDRLCMDTKTSWSYTAFLLIPSYISLALNVGALVSIAVYLTLGTTQLPQSFKRGFRSLAILTPLLGVHHIVLEYVPDTTFYSIVNAGISSSQGLLVAIIFCFTHDDVRSEMTRAWRRSFAYKPATTSNISSRFRPTLATASADCV